MLSLIFDTAFERGGQYKGDIATAHAGISGRRRIVHEGPPLSFVGLTFPFAIIEQGHEMHRRNACLRSVHRHSGIRRRGIIRRFAFLKLQEEAAQVLTDKMVVETEQLTAQTKKARAEARIFVTETKQIKAETKKARAESKMVVAALAKTNAGF